MKKIIPIALAIVLVLAVLTGCSGAKDAGAPKQEAPKTEANKPADKPAEKPVTYKDGKYEGVAEGMHEIKVSVEVAGGKIAKVTITKQEETPSIAKSALEKIPAAIVEKNSPVVDGVSGATVTSEGIMNAVKKALEAAK
jgi:uncharacterized protein with FMN-binding domain